MLTPQQREAIARRKRLERLEAKRARAEALRVLAARLVFFAIAFAMTLTVASAVFFVNLYAHSGGSSTYTVTYIDGSNTKTDVYKSVKSAYTVIDGELYANMTELSSFYSFITTGDRYEIRYILRNDTNDTLSLTIDTRSVTANGYELTLDKEIRLISGGIYAPLSLIENYISGLDIELDQDKHTLKFSRTVISDPTATSLEYAELRLKLRRQPELDNISESSLDADIKLATEPGRVIETPLEDVETAGDVIDAPVE